MALERVYVGGEILLYGDVGDPWGFGDGFTPSDVAQALAVHGPGDVTVHVNSGGGIAFDGVAIYSLLKAHPGAVSIIIDGVAASAASLLCMAGSSISMRPGALMMIHDASGVTFGTASDHEKSRDTLDKLSGQYARIYSARSGMSEDDARALMLAETWMTAEEAVAVGLATSVVDGDSAAVAFDYRIYAHAPQSLPVRVKPVSTAATAAQHKEPNMTVRTEPAEPTKTAEPTVAPKAWAVAFYASASKSRIEIAELNAIVEASMTLEAAQSALIDAMAAKTNADKPSATPSPALVTADERDKFIAGVTQAILAQQHLDKRDPGNEFNGIRPMALAELAVRRAGLKAGFDRNKIVATAITHTSSDFPLITQNIAEKAMLRGYEEQEETFQLWTSRGTLSDFKQGRRVGINALPSLPQVNEAGEYPHVTTGERGEPVQLATFGEIVTLTRRAIIDDDLGVFTTLPRALGRAARRTIGDAVYGVLVNNPSMADGVALFHAATHRNLATGGASALGINALIAATTAMGTQPDRSNPQTALNISPRWLIVPKALQPLAKQLMESTAEPGAPNAGTANRVAQLATVVTDARLDRASTTAWYLAANQSAVDTIEVQYLDGVETPYIEQAEEFDVDGMKFKVRIDFGVKALQWEGLYRAAGA